MQTIPIAFAITFSLVLFCAYFTFSIVKTQREQISSLLRVVSRNIESPMVFDDHPEVKRVLSSLSDESMFDVVVAKSNLNGTTIEGFNKTSTESSLIDGQLTFVRAFTLDCTWAECVYDMPIHHEDGIVGVLHVQSSNVMIYRSIAEMVGLSLLVVLGSVLVVYQVARRMSRSVTVPMNGLLKLVNTVSSTENYKLRSRPLAWLGVEIEEIDHLAEGFDRMLEHIEYRDRVLAEINLDLEKTIEDRTHELAEERLKGIESARMASLGEMASGIAHEINNPLAVIQASAEIIVSEQQEGGETLSPIAVKQAERILKVSARIAKIVKGLRTIARDGTREEFEPASIAMIIEETIDLCQSRFKNQGVELRIADTPADWSINCRSVQVSQVILNLLNNAFDAICEGQIQNGLVSVGVIKEIDGGFQIRVSDNGPGVPPGLEAKIMQPFFTTKGIGKGTGLGLSISRSIMAEHGGVLTLDLDRENKGTTFVLQFPSPQTQIQNLPLSQKVEQAS
jgi:signal transduction histidine kinase